MIYVVSAVSILVLLVLLVKNNAEAEEVSYRLEEERKENDRLQRRIMEIERESRNRQLALSSPSRRPSSTRQTPPAEPPVRATQPRNYWRNTETLRSSGAVPSISMPVHHHDDSLTTGIVLGAVLHEAMMETYRNIDHPAPIGDPSPSYDTSSSCRDDSFSSSSTDYGSSGSPTDYGSSSSSSDYGGSCDSSSSSSDSGSCSSDYGGSCDSSSSSSDSGSCSCE